MKIWQDLVKQAVLGSQRSTGNILLPTPELAQRQQHWQTLTAEQQLLNTLALLEAYRAVGQTGGMAMQAAVSTAEPESQAYCSAKIQQYIQRYIQDNNVGLVKEALALLSSHQQLLTPELLADFLTWCANNRADAAQICTVIGKRGLWLCALNPDWATLGLADISQNNSTWLDAHGRARWDLLAQALANDLTGTLAQLSDHWKTESAKDRQAALTVLANQLTAEMLPFLQAIADDRSQAVREQTTQLLAKLHDPTITALLLETVLASLTVTKPLLGKPQLHVNLPDTLAEIWQQRGIQEKLEYLPGYPEKIGVKSGWLYQWLSLTNPTLLAQHLNLNLAALLQAAVTSEFASILLSGLDAGARLHGCIAFLAPRFATVKQNEQTAWLLTANQTFPLSVIEPFLIRQLKQAKEREAWTLALAIADPHTELSSTLAMAIVDAFADTCTTETGFYSYDRKTLAYLAFKLPLADYDPLSRRLQQLEGSYIFELLKNFSQRNALHQEFAHE